MFSFCYKFFLNTIIFILCSAKIIASAPTFEPAKYIENITPKDKNIFLFLEGKNLKSFTKQLKLFYFSLRRGSRNKTIEWNSLVRWINSKTGLSLFENKKIQKMGIDNHLKFCLILYKSPIKIQGTIQLLIPALNSNKLYKYLKKYLYNRTQSNIKILDKVRELQKNKLLELSIGRHLFYLVKGTHHIILGNNKKMALKSTQIQKNNLYKSTIYQLFKKESSVKRKGHLASFFANSGLFNYIKKIRWFPFFKSYTPKTKLLLANTKLISGEVAVTSNQFNLSIQHLFETTFLEQGDKQIFDFELDFFKKKQGDYSVKIGSLKLDKNTDKKILHFTGLFNPKYIWHYQNKIPFINLYKIFPKNKIAQPLKKMLQFYLRGNISIIIIKPLAQRLPLHLQDTHFIANIGLKQILSKKTKKRLEYLLQKMLTNYKFQFIKETYKNKHDLWKFHWNERIKGQIISKTFFLLFHNAQLSILSKRENIDKVLNNSGKNVIKKHNNILSANTQESSGLILVDVNQLYDIINKSGLGALFPQYLSYIRRVKTLLIHSFQRKNSVFSEFKIILQ